VKIELFDFQKKHESAASLGTLCTATTLAIARALNSHLRWLTLIDHEGERLRSAMLSVQIKAWCG
jgi:hypothetical protein